MKRLVVLAAFALVASFVFAAVAVAEQAPEEQPVEEAEGQVEEAAGQEEVLETPAEEAAEEPVEEAVGADQGEVPAEESFEEQAEQSAEGQVETTVTDEEVITAATVEAPSVAQPEETMMMGGSTQPLPKSGGLGAGSILLPAAALLLGSGILAFAVLRRR